MLPDPPVYPSAVKPILDPAPPAPSHGAMSDAPRKVLVIEDDPAIRRFLHVALESQSYQVIEARTAKEGLLKAGLDQADVIILDLGLPDMDGVDLTRQLRAWSSVPIVVVSARGKEQDKVVALDAGADDYLTKPFGVQELLARMRVAMRRRAGTGPGEQSIFRVANVTVDMAARRVLLDQKQVHLTPNEYRLLTTLIKHAGKVLTHAFLLKEIWGPSSAGETHYLRVYMNQLRQKLEVNATRPVFLLTEAGVGYRLEPDAGA